MLLLEIIREFKKQSVLPIKIILMENGALTTEFKKLGTTYSWHLPEVNVFKLTFLQPVNLFIAKTFMFVKSLWILFCIRKTTITFSNTITNGHLHKKLLVVRSKFITYVHELEISIRAHTNEYTLHTVLKHSDFFLAGSIAVKNNLVSRHKIPASKVDVVYSSIPVLDRDKTAYSDQTHVLKKDLQIPDNAIIIGSAAENEWRKGFDLFFPLIRLYLNLYPATNAHFVWMGMKKDSEFYSRDIQDFESFNIHTCTHLITHGAGYLEHMALFDIHLLLSREDPYPLVVLDAASFGIPTVAFRDAGGSPEFIEDDCGYSIPYGDLFAMAKAIHVLETDVSLRQRFGSNAKEKVKKRHDQTIATKKILETINLLM